VKLAGNLLGNLFFLDNRVFVSLKSIFTSPGTMTWQYIDGKRKKYIPPITLYLLWHFTLLESNDGMQRKI